MSEYKFTYDEKEYILNEDNCSGLLNDEEKPVKNINLSNIIELITVLDDLQPFSYNFLQLFLLKLTLSGLLKFNISVKCPI